MAPSADGGVAAPLDADRGFAASDDRGARRNALKHGILADLALAGAADRALFAEALDALAAEFDPRPGQEEMLVRDLAVCDWRLRRVRIGEAQVFAAGPAMPDGEPWGAARDRPPTPRIAAVPIEAPPRPREPAPVRIKPVDPEDALPPLGRAADALRRRRRLKAALGHLERYIASFPAYMKAHDAALAELDGATRALWDTRQSPVPNGFGWGPSSFPEDASERGLRSLLDWLRLLEQYDDEAVAAWREPARIEAERRTRKLEADAQKEREAAMDVWRVEAHAHDQEVQALRMLAHDEHERRLRRADDRADAEWRDSEAARTGEPARFAAAAASREIKNIAAYHTTIVRDRERTLNLLLRLQQVRLANETLAAQRRLAELKADGIAARRDGGRTEAAPVAASPAPPVAAGVSAAVTIVPAAPASSERDHPVGAGGPERAAFKALALSRRAAIAAALDLLQEGRPPAYGVALAQLDGLLQRAWGGRVAGDPGVREAKADFAPHAARWTGQKTAAALRDWLRRVQAADEAVIRGE